MKKPKIVKKFFDCPHCDKSLSKKTFKKHKKLFTVSAMHDPGKEPHQYGVYLNLLKVRLDLSVEVSV